MARLGQGRPGEIGDSEARPGGAGDAGASDEYAALLDAFAEFGGRQGRQFAEEFPARTHHA